MLLENLPVLLPEIVDELMQWQPTTYGPISRGRPYRAAAGALAAYDRIAAAPRAHFDAMVEQLDAQALAIVAEIGSHRDGSGGLDADSIAAFCAVAARQLRESLDAAAQFVNSGRGPVSETPQCMADRLLAQ